MARKRRLVQGEWKGTGVIGLMVNRKSSDIQEALTADLAQGAMSVEISSNCCTVVGTRCASNRQQVEV